LQMMSGLTMYQHCVRQNPAMTEETVAAVLRVTLAFGVLAFGFACWHIYLSTHHTEDMTGAVASIEGKSLLVAIESWVIINFFITFFSHIHVRHHAADWAGEAQQQTEDKMGFSGAPFAILNTVFGIILIGLLAAETQDLTAAPNMDTNAVGLNAAGTYMLGFGLIFAVFQTGAGFTMLEAVTGLFKGTGANLVFATNKVALAIGVLAMGFACRHINLFIRDGAPPGASANNVALVHAIESFLIINFFIAWAIQALSTKTAW